MVIVHLNCIFCKPYIDWWISSILNTNVDKVIITYGIYDKVREIADFLDVDLDDGTVDTIRSWPLFKVVPIVGAGQADHYQAVWNYAEDGDLIYLCDSDEFPLYGSVESMVETMDMIDEEDVYIQAANVTFSSKITRAMVCEDMLPQFGIGRQYFNGYAKCSKWIRIAMVRKVPGQRWVHRDVDASFVDESGSSWFTPERCFIWPNIDKLHFAFCDPAWFLIKRIFYNSSKSIVDAAKKVSIECKGKDNFLEGHVWPGHTTFQWMGPWPEGFDPVLVQKGLDERWKIAHKILEKINEL